LFDKVQIKLDDDRSFTIVKKNSGLKIDNIRCDDQKLDGYFLTDHELKTGTKMVITTE